MRILKDILTQFECCYDVLNTFLLVIKRQVVRMAEENNAYNCLRFCTVTWQPVANNYQFSHFSKGRETKNSEVGDSVLQLCHCNP